MYSGDLYARIVSGMDTESAMRQIEHEERIGDGWQADSDAVEAHLKAQIRRGRWELLLVLLANCAIWALVIVAAWWVWRLI